MHTSEVLVVAGTVRGSRRSPAIARWAAGLGAAETARAWTPIDLSELDLALDDEPHLPALGRYERESTRAWSRRVAAAAAVVLVTPQYNWGYPAALKNAIDHLHAEWRDKPVLIVAYGARGGDRVARQLREVMSGVHARLAAATPGLVLSRARIEADDGAVEPELDFADQRAELLQGLRELAGMFAVDASPSR